MGQRSSAPGLGEEASKPRPRRPTVERPSRSPGVWLTTTPSGSVEVTVRTSTSSPARSSIESASRSCRPSTLGTVTCFGAAAPETVRTTTVSACMRGAGSGTCFRTRSTGSSDSILRKRTCTPSCSSRARASARVRPVTSGAVPSAGVSGVVVGGAVSSEAVVGDAPASSSSRPASQIPAGTSRTMRRTPSSASTSPGPMSGGNRRTGGSEATPC